MNQVAQIVHCVVFKEKGCNDKVACRCCCDRLARATQKLFVFSLIISALIAWHHRYHSLISEFGIKTTSERDWFDLFSNLLAVPWLLHPIAISLCL